MKRTAARPSGKLPARTMLRPLRRMANGGPADAYGIQHPTATRDPMAGQATPPTAPPNSNYVGGAMMSPGTPGDAPLIIGERRGGTGPYASAAEEDAAHARRAAEGALHDAKWRGASKRELSGLQQAAAALAPGAGTDLAPPTAAPKAPPVLASTPAPMPTGQALTDSLWDIGVTKRGSALDDFRAGTIDATQLGTIDAGLSAASTALRGGTSAAAFNPPPIAPGITSGLSLPTQGYAHGGPAWDARHGGQVPTAKRPGVDQVPAMLDAPPDGPPEYAVPGDTAQKLDVDLGGTGQPPYPALERYRMATHDFGKVEARRQAQKRGKPQRPVKRADGGAVGKMRGYLGRLTGAGDEPPPPPPADQKPAALGDGGIGAEDAPPAVDMVSVMRDIRAKNPPPQMPPGYANGGPVSYGDPEALAREYERQTGRAPSVPPASAEEGRRRADALVPLPPRDPAIYGSPAGGGVEAATDLGATTAADVSAWRPGRAKTAEGPGAPMSRADAALLKKRAEVDPIIAREVAETPLPVSALQDSALRDAGFVPGAPAVRPADAFVKRPPGVLSGQPAGIPEQVQMQMERVQREGRDPSQNRELRDRGLTQWDPKFHGAGENALRAAQGFLSAIRDGSNAPSGQAQQSAQPPVPTASWQERVRQAADTGDQWLLDQARRVGERFQSGVRNAQASAQAGGAGGGVVAPPVSPPPAAPAPPATTTPPIATPGPRGGDTESPVPPVGALAQLRGQLPSSPAPGPRTIGDQSQTAPPAGTSAPMFQREDSPESAAAYNRQITAAGGRVRVGPGGVTEYEMSANQPVTAMDLARQVRASGGPNWDALSPENVARVTAPGYKTSGDGMFNPRDTLPAARAESALAQARDWYGMRANERGRLPDAWADRMGVARETPPPPPSIEERRLGLDAAKARIEYANSEAGRSNERAMKAAEIAANSGKEDAKAWTDAENSLRDLWTGKAAGKGAGADGLAGAADGASGLPQEAQAFGMEQSARMMQLPAFRTLGPLGLYGIIAPAASRIIDPRTAMKRLMAAKGAKEETPELQAEAWQMYQNSVLDAKAYLADSLGATRGRGAQQ